MKINWKQLSNDLKSVFLKHFRPEVDKDPSEVQLLKMIVSLQKQQKDMNKIREGIGDSARLLKDDQI